MDARDVSGPASVGIVHDGIFGDLETEEVYALLTAAGTQPTGTATITQIGRIDGMTGALTAARIPLSMPIAVAYGAGVFSGYGEALIGAPAAASLQWWHIELPTGVVTRLGMTQNPTHRGCENWAWWGVAEFFGDVRPATSMVEVSRLIDPAMLVEIEAEAVIGASE